MEIFLVVNIIITLLYVFANVYITENHTGAHGGFGMADIVYLIMEHTKIKYILCGSWLIYIVLALTRGKTI